MSKLSEAADKYKDEDFERNPDGYTIAPYANEETVPTAFEQGGLWVLDEVAKILKKAGEAALASKIRERIQG